MADTSNRGLGSPNMSEEVKRSIQSAGGHAQGQENNQENFANNRRKAQKAGEQSHKHD